MQQFFDYSPDVQTALQNKQPILALESTLITHGLPFPYNLEIAHAVEDIVRQHHVIPATIAILNGKIKIGLTSTELDILVKDKNVAKASRRDIPYLLSQGLNAGTTVAATLFCADYAGIKLFATGGIGGVHRGDQQDISADLIELARAPIAVICAGAKAILDLPKTLEFLETVSVPVIGYRTATLPAFYTATTPYHLTTQVNDLNELVKLLRIHWQLGLSSGVLITQPISLEDEIPTETIEPVIAQALETASQQCIQGKSLTPFLLAEVAKVTEGKSLQANIQLIKNNVRLGAALAYQLSVT